jgi:ubiquinone/menaquinone biosynthesis C-methylase UbiE
MASEEAAGTPYFWSEVSEAQVAFNNRRGPNEIEFLLPRLEPGLRVADLGCGAGSITCDLAALVAPGEVYGVDISDSAIAGAQSLAGERGLSNAIFRVGDAVDTKLPSGRFDIVVISGMLSYLRQPERAIAEGLRLLVPGGTIGIREMMKEGDWFAGPHSELLNEINQMLIEGIRERGGDPFFGKRLKRILTEAGFASVNGRPQYSHTFTSTIRVGDLYVAYLNNPSSVGKLASRGITTDAQRSEAVVRVQQWAADPSSVVAVAEMVAWADKRAKPG